ncbi:MAG: hypothetical protein CVU29_10555 [Betaproteobacteria bacterium HGW-Betaproteobacteria-22]|nr:MAG: hypothetical protein CVU29_10555 [Betaproteobacteria bacterium HGW-Betaproteobacteria-22]
MARIKLVLLFLITTSTWVHHAYALESKTENNPSQNDLQKTPSTHQVRLATLDSQNKNYLNQALQKQDSHVRGNPEHTTDHTINTKEEKKEIANIKTDDRYQIIANKTEQTKITTNETQTQNRTNHIIGAWSILKFIIGLPFL